MKVAKTHKCKGKEYKVPRSATFKNKVKRNPHATASQGSKRKR